MRAERFRKWLSASPAQEGRFGAREITVQVVPGATVLTIAVSGRSTVESSPHLRSVLLGLIRQHTSQLVLIDMSGLSYLDMSGIATLLEALKAATKRSVRLRLAGLRGQVRKLAEIAQLDAIFRAWGSEVEFL